MRPLEFADKFSNIIKDEKRQIQKFLGTLTYASDFFSLFKTFVKGLGRSQSPGQMCKLK